MKNNFAILRLSLILLMLLAVGMIATADTASALPAAPQLDYPWNGMNVGGTTIPFRWYDVYGAYDYFLQIATDPGFTDIVYGNWMGDTTGIDLCCFSDIGEWYYWRVTAYDGEVGPPSNTWFFINGPSAPPATPTLSSPANGANASGTTVIFQWNQAARATNYYLQVATDAGFSNTIYSDWVGNYLGVSLSGFPDNGQSYYWRVLASNSLGSSSYSGAWSLVNGPSAVPAAPTLSSPANSSNAAGTTVSFTWNPAARAIDYYLEVATDGRFTNIIYGEWIGNYTGVNLSGLPDNGQTYYWRVAAWNSLGTSNYSGVWNLINGPSAIPDTPVLGSPTDGANAAGTTIQFQWNQAARTSDYYLEVATDAGFFNIIYGQWIGNYIGIDISGFPDNGQTFYWRVTASNPLGQSPVSVAWSVINGPSSVPDIPSLSSPADVSNVPGTMIQFRWAAAARANDYYLQVATDAGFTNLVFDSWLGGNYTGVDISNFPDNGQTYYWRVAAGNSLGSSNSSGAWSLINGPSNIPATPVLSSPANGANVPGTTILFQWNAAARANDYYLQVAADAGFANTVFGQWIGNYIGINLSGFPNNGQTYYWRVAARNVLGSSPYSGTWSFVNGTPPPPPPSTCSSTYGSGIGVLGDNKDHIDTCQDSSSGTYYLYDLSRRANNNPHGHNGQMAADEQIETYYYGNNVAMSDSDNKWNAPNQASGVDAHVYAAVVYDYLLFEHGLNSFDKAGSTMRSVVEDQTDVNNAVWKGSYVTYYIGSGQQSYAGALDVVAHEWAHAVTEKASSRKVVICLNGRPTTSLCYESESGSLNEAFSDWMGVAVEHAYGDPDYWTIGEGIKPLRDVSDPPAYLAYCQGQWRPQPDHMSEYLVCGTDNAHVHFNSGIPNKMFYLLSAGGAHPDSNINVQGITIEKAIRIATRANINYWKNKTSFIGAADKMVNAAWDIYGLSSNEVNQVKNAWAAVGVMTLPILTASVSPSGGGTVSGDGSYEWGTTATVTAAPDSGYIFVNWTENSVEVSAFASYTFTVDGDRTLVANFTPVPDISVNPASYDFGSFYVGTPSPNQTFTVTNTGMSELTIQSVSIAGTDTLDFSYIDMCTGDILSPSENCLISVGFLPLSAGTKNAVLSIQSDEPVTPVVDVPLSGTGLNNPPVASTTGPYSAIEGQAISLDGSGSTDSDGTITLYEWDIDNNGTYDYSSSSPTQSHTYVQNGAYTIKLRVTDDLGATDEATTTANIPDTSPTADLTGSPTSGVAPLTVHFINNSTGYDQPLSYQWDFENNGSTDSTVQNPTNIYNNPGTYSVKLTVTDSDGSTDTLIRTDYITVTSNEDWTATGLWHEVPDSATPGGRPFTSTSDNSWWYGQDSTGDYDTGSANSGDLISPSYDITSGQVLTFWSWEQTENDAGYDTRKVYISTDNGANWTEIKTLYGTENQWYKVEIDLADYAGQTVQFKFTFDTVDDLYNNYEGWYIDDVEVTIPDSDGDGIPDDGDNSGVIGDNPCTGGNTVSCDDNCSATPNPGQQDTDGDLYGNICDCDLDNDGVVGFNDFNIFKAAWGSDSSSSNWNPDADFDSDGAVGFNDFNIFKTRWGTSAPWE